LRRLIKDQSLLKAECPQMVREPDQSA